MATAARSERVETERAVDFQSCWAELELPPHVRDVLSAAPLVQAPETRQQLLDWALGRSTGDTDWRLGQSRRPRTSTRPSSRPPAWAAIVEAMITKARNGLAINFPDPAMRRRDPDAMVIGDDLPTDKPTYEQRFGETFDKTRQQTLDWLKTQELVAMPFYAGTDELGYGSLLIVPRQAAFFAAALADLQGMIPRSQVPADFKITGGVLFVAPPFRHTHFGGRQVVVHDRTATHQEIFAYNLYPGPSAKKGVYSMLLDIGEREGWTTNHCAAVAVVTPYENQLDPHARGRSGRRQERDDRAHPSHGGWPPAARAQRRHQRRAHPESARSLPPAAHCRRHGLRASQLPGPARTAHHRRRGERAGSCASTTSTATAPRRISSGCASIRRSRSSFSITTSCPAAHA